MTLTLFKNPFPSFIEHYEELSSTNDTAFEILFERGKKANGGIVVAENQSNGRGRMGRKWVSKKGDSLLLSLILIPPENYFKEFIPLGAGLSVVRCIKKCCGVDVKLKWPNDIVFDGKKLGGILVESKTMGKTPSGFVIGIGLNVKGKKDDFPFELRNKVSTIEEVSQKECDKNHLLKFLIKELKEIYNFSFSDKIVFMAELKREFIHRKGDRIKINLGNEILEGIFVEINDEGRMVINTAKGEMVIIQGEVEGL